MNDREQLQRMYPMSGDPGQDEFARVDEWLADGRRVALATVVSTWGSSPRPVGSHLLVNDAGEFFKRYFF